MHPSRTSTSTSILLLYLQLLTRKKTKWRKITTTINCNLLLFIRLVLLMRSRDYLLNSFLYTQKKFIHSFTFCYFFFFCYNVFCFALTLRARMFRIDDHDRKQRWGREATFKKKKKKKHANNWNNVVDLPSPISLLFLLHFRF